MNEKQKANVKMLTKFYGIKFEFDAANRLYVAKSKTGKVLMSWTSFDDKISACKGPEYLPACFRQ